jgi:hypothetical protein
MVSRLRAIHSCTDPTSGQISELLDSTKYFAVVLYQLFYLARSFSQVKISLSLLLLPLPLSLPLPLLPPPPPPPLPLSLPLIHF